MRSHSHLLLGRPTYPVLDYHYHPAGPGPERAPSATCCLLPPPHLPLAIAIEPVLEAHRPVELLSARSPGALL